MKTCTATTGKSVPVSDPHLKIILAGIKEAYRRMVEEKRRKGQMMVVMNEDGRIVKVKP